MERTFPRYGWLGAAIILAAEILLLRGVRVVGMYFTPIVWTGWILFADALARRIAGRSPIANRRREFLLTIPASIACWYVFEGINLLLQNWSYHGMPENVAARWLGYAWSYGTILPAIFVTAALIESLLGDRLRGRRPIDPGPRLRRAFFWTGLGLFVVTLVFPSRWLAPLPWVSVLLWFEGMNDHLGIGSFSSRLRRGDYTLVVSLLVSGLVCGLLWEGWNWGAATRWQYHVPYLPNVKLFEMPVLGFLGFPPFALECWLMYRFARHVTPIGTAADVFGLPWRDGADNAR
ncbi:MAG TPA: hypothetical protein ENO23_09390 [Alphaproteobacteria bacterium]|nr:hypothetical protein [Alphaproteobacteria bacterium]